MYRRLTATTTTEAQGILTEALVAIDTELRRRGTAEAPLRVTVHYDVDDMDRDGLLDVDECLHLPYDGIPPGLQPRNCHPEYAAWNASSATPRRRGILERLLGH